MRAYMGYSAIMGPREMACLIFARTAREARPLAAREVDTEFIDVRVTWLRDSPWLFEQADPGKLSRGEAHVIGCPTSCAWCNLWGMELTDGVCEECQPDEDEARAKMKEAPDA